MKASQFLAITLPLALASVASAATTSIVFDSSYDLYRDFRITQRPGNLTYIQESGSTYIRHTGHNTESAFVYDLDGAGPGLTTYTIGVGDILSVSTQVRFTGTNSTTTHNSSFGFIFGNATAGHLAILNFNQSGANEQFRITANNATLAGNAGTIPTTGTSSTGYLTGVNVFAPDVFTTITATYEVLSVSSYRISLIAGGQTVYRDFTDTTPLADIQIGLRMNNPATTTYLVDMNIVPEPATAALTALGSLALLRRRR